MTMSATTNTIPTSTSRTKATSHTTTVPYFVLKLSDGRAKALFTVPSDMAEILCMNPILCRGASFDLELDVVSQGRKMRQNQSNNSNSNSNNSTQNTSFLAAQFTSPNPEETARAISERLRIRMNAATANNSNSDNMPSLSGMLGMQ